MNNPNSHSPEVLSAPEGGMQDLCHCSLACGLGFRPLGVWSLGFRVSCSLGLRSLGVWSLGFGVWILGLGVYSLGFGVSTPTCYMSLQGFIAGS